MVAGVQEKNRHVLDCDCGEDEVDSHVLRLKTAREATGRVILVGAARHRSTRLWRQSLAGFCDSDRPSI